MICKVNKYKSYSVAFMHVNSPPVDLATDGLSSFGYELTDHRLRIIHSVIEKKYINDVDDFWMELHNEKKISWATVYKTINILCSIGFLIRISDQHEKGRYRISSGKGELQ